MLKELARLWGGMLVLHGYVTDINALRELARRDAATRLGKPTPGLRTQGSKPAAARQGQPA